MAGHFYTKKMSAASALKSVLVDILRPKVLAVISIFLRIFLLVWSHVQDRYMDVKFTDIDYNVFSDAAGYVAKGQSPFNRQTYRYSPLIAYLLLPNVWIWRDFGKVLFAACDLLVGCVLYKMARPRVTSTTKSQSPKHQRYAEFKATLGASFWLINPLVATVSVRGSTESVLALFVVGTVYLLLNDHVFLSAVTFGIVVHLKIYPVIYSLPIFLYLGHEGENGSFLKKLIPNKKQIIFVLVSTAVFVGLTEGFHYKYGAEYLNEAFLYHFKRTDPKHNFSVFFYMLYLLESTSVLKLMSVAAFIPQAVLVIISGVVYHKDLPFCLFVQTVLFVSFNKICTSQYFLWYLALLPLVVPQLKISLLRGIVLAGSWLGAQGLWLGFAYLLEFRGASVFEGVWLSSVLFLLVNIFVLRDIIQHYVPVKSRLKTQ